MPERVGIVGCGLMGQAIIHNLIEAGFEVQGFDVASNRMDDLAGQGGIPVGSPAEAAQGVGWLVTSLPSSEIVREVMFGKGGVVHGAGKDLIVADATTARPQDSERLGSELRERGIRFLDAAVSGTSAMAWKKDLIIVAGGEAEDFHACRPYFDAMARASYHTGPVGSGGFVKLIINLILAGNRLVLAEGLVIAMKAGLDTANLLEILKDSACFSKTMIDKGPKMVHADYKPEGLVRTNVKDSRLMLEQGQRYNSPMIVASLWAQMFQTAYEMGFGEKDTTSFIEILRGMAGLPSRI